MTNAERDAKRLQAEMVDRQRLTRRHPFEQGGPRVGDRDCRCGHDRYHDIHR